MHVSARGWWRYACDRIAAMNVVVAIAIVLGISGAQLLWPMRVSPYGFKTWMDPVRDWSWTAVPAGLGAQMVFAEPVDHGFFLGPVDPIMNPVKHEARMPDAIWRVVTHQNGNGFAIGRIGVGWHWVECVFLSSVKPLGLIGNGPARRAVRMIEADRFEVGWWRAGAAVVAVWIGLEVLRLVVIGIRTFARMKANRCTVCGYSLASLGCAACPECGTERDGPNARPLAG